MVFTRVEGPFDLANTLESGQTFRWRREGEGFTGVVFGNVVNLVSVAGGLRLISAPDEERRVEPLVRDYLGLDVDLEHVYDAITIDGRLKDAIERYRGMRVLRQNPWECLVSFICSSASNIPRITRNVESICTSFGRPIAVDLGTPRHAFPTPHELAAAGKESLFELGLGYRAGYIASTSRAIADGRLDLMALREDPYDAALADLIELDGVGDKVANCVLLFSLDKPQAFPVDVWIRRAVREWYHVGSNGSLSAKNARLWGMRYFGQYAGYANQYLFHDRRLMGRANQRA